MYFEDFFLSFNMVFNHISIHNIFGFLRLKIANIEFEPRPLLKKNQFFWSNPYKIEIMITSLIEMLPRVTKLWSHDHIYNII